MLLIGSQAIATVYDDFRDVTKSDFDLIATREEIETHTKGYELTSDKPWHFRCTFGPTYRTEYELDDNNTATAIRKDILNSSFCYDKWMQAVMMMKRSHLYWPYQWEKTINDYHFLKSKGIVLNDFYTGLLKERIKETELRLGKPMVPSLAMSKDEFFGKSAQRVTYYFDHDEIHYIMAHREKPMYEYMQSQDLPNGGDKSVWCEKNKWLSLTDEQRNQCVQEEAYVISIERKILPMLWAGAPLWTAHEAFKWAVMRIGTNLTSGWFRDWTIENYPTIISTANKDYVTKFLGAYENGKITRVK